MYNSQYIPDLETTVDNNITYCTPELSDFCIGFQYDKWIDAYPEGFWTNQEFNTEYRVPSKEVLQQLIKTKKVRTYALDKYSLEKLGFQGNELLENTYTKTYDDIEWIYVVVFHSKYLTIELFHKDRMVNNLVFKGVVRTVSEMEKLLNQIDIYTNGE